MEEGVIEGEIKESIEESLESEPEDKPKKKNDGLLRCEKCGSAFIYVRFKSKQVVCRRCGHITDIED